MLVFNNQQRSGYEEVVFYSPRYYRSIKEMDAIFRFAGWLIDHMAEDMENMISYQFIKYMDDKSLARYEAFLGVTKDSKKTLEERKEYINALLVGAGKMSADKISALIKQFSDCACENIVLEGSVLHIGIVVSKYIDQGLRNNIYEIIEKRLPANLSIDIAFDTAVMGKIYIGSVMHEADILELKQR